MSPGKRNLCTRGFFLGLTIVFFLVLQVLQPRQAKGAAKKSKDTGKLQRFYIVRMFTSDYVPDWADYITDVQTQGEGVKVRSTFELLLRNLDCPEYVSVKAVEKKPYQHQPSRVGRAMSTYARSTKKTYIQP